MDFSKKNKPQDGDESTPSSVPSIQVKKPKRGAFLEDRIPSIRKVNAERDSRINLLAKANLLLALFLLGNVSYLSYRITRTGAPSQTFVQYYEHAGIMVPVSTVNAAQLQKPVPFDIQKTSDIAPIIALAMAASPPSKPASSTLGSASGTEAAASALPRPATPPDAAASAAPAATR